MQISKLARAIAGVAALVGWAAVILQFILITRNLGPALGTWRFIGYFTVLSNIAVAIIASAVAVGRHNRLTSSGTMLMGLTAIVTVGLVYSAVLRSLWQPTGLQKLADAGLHDVTPSLFAALWAVMPHGALRWRDMGRALAAPALYLGYALARGSVDGWYPYFFLDPTTQSVTSLLGSIAGMMAVFALIAALAIALDRKLGLRAPRQ